MTSASTFVKAEASATNQSPQGETKGKFSNILRSSLTKVSLPVFWSIETPYKYTLGFNATVKSVTLK